MATDHSGGDGKENRNITMHISVFCGSSMPHNKEIVEAAAALGRSVVSPKKASDYIPPTEDAEAKALPSNKGKKRKKNG